MRIDSRSLVQNSFAEKPKTDVKSEQKIEQAPSVARRENAEPKTEVVVAPKSEPQGQQDMNEPEDSDDRRLRNAVEHANQTMRHAKTKCEFFYHEDTKRVSIKVIDEETKEVVREIPPEETLDMLAKMWELAGLLVDEKR